MSENTGEKMYQAQLMEQVVESRWDDVHSQAAAERVVARVLGEGRKVEEVDAELGIYLVELTDEEILRLARDGYLNENNPAGTAEILIELP
jgi:hypothetical protein